MAVFDMAILVPKSDELATVERFFGADFSSPEIELEIVDLPVFSLEIAGLRTAVVTLGGQGNAIAMSVTDHLISQLNPALVFLLGTALGNSARCSLCSVVVSEMVHDLSERRMTDAGVIFREKMHEPAGRLRREVGRYHNTYNQQRLGEAIKVFARDSGIRGFDAVADGATVEFEHIGAGSDLIEGNFQQTIWNRDDRIACYDMESAGFAASALQHSGIMWMVIRGVSDFGDSKTKRTRELRTLSTAAAAAFLSDFVTEGLRSCHPRTMRTPVSQGTTLNPEHFYSRIDGFEWFRNRLRERLGIELPQTPLGRYLTLEGFQAICEKGSVEKGWLRDALFRLREEYFEEKYLDYTYEEDIRGFVPGWSEEIIDIFRRLAIRFEVSDILDVGGGNGLELPPLFTGAQSVTCVEISTRMLEKAKERFPGLKTCYACAEELKGIETSSIDVYTSFRTYMSRFFDMQAAVSEAYRVLKPGGWAVISIANGYLVTNDAGEKEVVRGLRVPGTRQTVDVHEPYRVQRRLRELLSDFGFANIQLSSLNTDIYMWAQVPPAR